MTELLAVDLNRFNLEGDLTLSVGWRSGNKMKLGRIETSSDLREQFREAIIRTVQNVAERTAEAWSAEADMTAETYLVARVDNLGDRPELVASFRGVALAEALSRAETIPPLHAGDLPVADMVIYALTVGDVGERATFLRRMNPRRGLRKGKIFTSLRDSLTRIDEPVFAFDELTDIIFAGEDVIVLSGTAFSALFRSQEELRAQVPRWSEELSSHVPISDASKELIISRALNVTRVRTRLESIATRGHLEGVSSEQLRQSMISVGIDPDEMMDSDGRLNLTEDTVDRAVNFLNEDLFAGSITSIPFRADKKAPAS